MYFPKMKKEYMYLPLDVGVVCSGFAKASFYNREFKISSSPSSSSSCTAVGRKFYVYSLMSTITVDVLHVILPTLCTCFVIYGLSIAVFLLREKLALSV
jgi:hypothetical protein